MKRKTIARVAHQVNKAYCESQGDMSVQDWQRTTAAHRASMLAGVDMHIANPASSPQAQHEAWMAAKVADGWKWGEVKDEAAKTHPAMLPYDELPPVQRAKDFIFKAIVSQLKDLADEDGKAEPSMSADRISVKYVGHGGNRPIHKDGIYGTELVWAYGQSLMVPSAIATVMLARHPEVYAPGDATDEVPDVADKRAENDAEFERTQQVRDSINVMEKDAVAAFVRLHFRQELADASVGEMRAQAVQLVDQFGAP